MAILVLKISSENQTLTKVR